MRHIPDKLTTLLLCIALCGALTACEQKAPSRGSPMIRANTVRDVLGIKKETGLPVIGLIKQVYDGFDGYITPTMEEVDALAEAGADIIAIDCTDRRRGDGLSPWEYIRSIKAKYPRIQFPNEIHLNAAAIFFLVC